MSDVETRTNAYFEYLKSEGYVPRIDDDGDIIFKKEGLIYVIRIDANDPDFFQLMLPNIWKAEDDTSRREAIEACNLTTRQIKVAKLFVFDDNSVWASAELFAESPEAVTKVMPRCLSALASSTQIFSRAMQGGQPG